MHLPPAGVWPDQSRSDGASLQRWDRKWLCSLCFCPFYRRLNKRSAVATLPGRLYFTFRESGHTSKENKGRLTVGRFPTGHLNNRRKRLLAKLRENGSVTSISEIQQRI